MKTIRLTQDYGQGFRGFPLLSRRRLFAFLPARLVHLVYGETTATLRRRLVFFFRTPPSVLLGTVAEHRRQRTLH